MNITSCTLTSHIAKSFKAYHTIRQIQEIIQRTSPSTNDPTLVDLQLRSAVSNSHCHESISEKNRSIQLSPWKPSQTSCLVFRRPRSLSRRAAAERKGRVVVSLPVSRRQKSRWEPALSRSPACVANAHAHVERTRACEHTARTQPRTHTSKRVAARAT